MQKSFIKNTVIITQTDTTVGFLSKSKEKLAQKKQRLPGKEFLKVVPSFYESKSLGRVPNRWKRYFRYSKKRSFIFSNGLSVRVVKDGEHSNFLQIYGSFFSSSANLSGQSFRKNIAINLADIIVEDNRGLFEDTPSQIIKLSKERLKKLR